MKFQYCWLFAKDTVIKYYHNLQLFQILLAGKKAFGKYLAHLINASIHHNSVYKQNIFSVYILHYFYYYKEAWPNAAKYICEYFHK